MPRLLKAACIGAGFALLVGVAGAAAQGGAGAAGGMRGTMGGGRLDSAGVERLRRSLPQYGLGPEYAAGLAALQAQDFKRAALAGGQLTEAAPTSVDAWRLLGAAAGGQGDWRVSRRAYERLLKLAPDDANGHAGLGLALVGLRDGKAQGQLDWLKDRARSCGETCAEAARLKSFTAAVEDAMSAAAAAPARS